MKRLLCIMIILAFCLTLACPAFAEEGTFVPSISYKDGPDIIDGEMKEENVEDCLIVTSIRGAVEKTTDISQGARDLLLEVYKKLDSGEMRLPMEEDYVIRELVDLSWKQMDCIEELHVHEDDLEKDGITVTVDFYLGVKASSQILVFAYRDGKWGEVESAINNGDGTITCVFEHFCPVAFCVRDPKGGSETGDIAGRNLMLWFVLMAVSSAAIITISYKRYRNNR